MARWNATVASREFDARGVLCISDLISAAELAALRAECDKLRSGISDDSLLASDCVVDIPPAAMLAEDAVARQTAADYLAARGGSSEVADLLLGGLPSAAAAVLGSSAASAVQCFLFNEHYICKPARVGGAFGWHTDAAHQLEALLALGHDVGTLAYVSCWVPLDNITSENGALLLLPRDAPQPPGVDALKPANAACDAWLQREGAPMHGLTTIGLRAGDLLLFSSTIWHASEPNASSAVRRAYYAQYSPCVVGGSAHSGAPLALAVPARVNDATGCRLGRARFASLRSVAVAAAAEGEMQGLQSRKKRVRGGE